MADLMLPPIEDVINIDVNLLGMQALREYADTVRQSVTNEIDFSRQ